MAASYLQFYQGDDWVFQVTLTNPDGSAQNLTGASPLLYVYYGPQAEVIAEVAPAVGPNTVLASGQIQFVVPKASTASVPADPTTLPATYTFPTRAKLSVTDTQGNTETQGVIPINVLGV